MHPRIPSDLWIWLLVFTIFLVIVGCTFYATGSPGWAQLWWVFASGTAGATVIAWLDR